MSSSVLKKDTWMEERVKYKLERGHSDLTICHDGFWLYSGPYDFHYAENTDGITESTEFAKFWMNKSKVGQYT